MLISCFGESKLRKKVIKEQFSILESKRDHYVLKLLNRYRNDVYWELFSQFDLNDTLYCYEHIRDDYVYYCSLWSKDKYFNLKNNETHGETFFNSITELYIPYYYKEIVENFDTAYINNINKNGSTVNDGGMVIISRFFKFDNKIEVNIDVHQTIAPIDEIDNFKIN